MKKWLMRHAVTKEDGWEWQPMSGWHGSVGRGLLIKEIDMREKDDFYPTPPEGVRPLIEFLSEMLAFELHCYDKDIWEPACGDGAISKVLEKEYDQRVVSSDLVDRGYGETGVDFLMTTKMPAPWIVTNPPYKLANDFVKHGLKLIANDRHSSGMALLLRLSFLEGQKRYKEIFKDNPPRDVLVFSKRMTLWRGDQERAGNGTTAYAWFIWYRGCLDLEEDSIKKTEVHWI